MRKPVQHIRSFVRREGRITEGQRQALEKYWGKYGVDFNGARLDLDRMFHRTAPKVLDIGPGMGTTTIALAKNNPENDYLAVEVHRPGVGSLLRQIVLNDLTNIRVSNHDVVEVLQHQISENSLDMVYIFFPDPWPKKRHHKRRLITESFLHILKPRLKANARIFIATDWADYASHIMDVFNQTQDYFNLAGDNQTAPRPYWLLQTKFEQRGYHYHHKVWNFAFARRYSQNTSLKSWIAVNSPV
jgi:tRNA (guanine-N7-)-methyltransferase